MAIEIEQVIQPRQRLYVSRPIDNCLGRQYTVEDDLWLNVVTIVKDELTGMRLIGCSCGFDETCSHILLVEETEQAYYAEAERRTKYVDVFDPNNLEGIC